MKKRQWEFTNPLHERYLFEEDEQGNIRTVKFLGYETPDGRLIKRGE